MRRGGRQPAFGIVGAPVATAAPAGEAGRYGFVPREGLRIDRAGPDPVLDGDRRCGAAR